jgi:hypothetical protein
MKRSSSSVGVEHFAKRISGRREADGGDSQGSGSVSSSDKDTPMAAPRPSLASSPIAANSAMSALYTDLSSEHGTVFDRWPDIEHGLPMLNHIDMIYRPRRKVHVDFYDAEGNRQLVTHELNHRRQAAVINQYVKSICSNGLSQKVRGEACAVPSKGGGSPYKLLTFGSLSRAAYICFETERNRR